MAQKRQNAADENVHLSLLAALFLRFAPGSVWTARHPYPLLFATISGAHLYGFPSPDSDYDVRGAHILPVEDALSLLPRRETIEVSGVRAGIQVDLVTHDVLKFFRLLLKRNGYVLEQFGMAVINGRSARLWRQATSNTALGELI